MDLLINTFINLPKCAYVSVCAIYEHGFASTIKVFLLLSLFYKQLFVSTVCNDVTHVLLIRVFKTSLQELFTFSLHFFLYLEQSVSAQASL